MEQLEKNPESKINIRFPDCDPFNHLNNSKYIDYFLNAREDHLLTYYGFDLAKLAKENDIAWFVTQNQIAYLKPAAIMETVVMQSRLLSFNEKELMIESTMWNKEKTRLKAVLWTKFIHFNFVTKRTEIHSEELTNILQQVLNPLVPDANFEERIKQLKQITNGDQ